MVAATPTHRLRLQRLFVRDFRNLASVDIEPSSGINVLFGENGQGKTSVLEAIYFLATSRSFRTKSAELVVRHGATATSVRGRFFDQAAAPGVTDGPPREQLVTVVGRRCTTRIDGNAPASLAQYATRSPAVVFHPDELTLSTGPAAGRRTLLDRVALFVDAASLGHRASYTRALKARHELLRRGRGSDAELEVFETLCATHGAALTATRARAVAALTPVVLSAFERIAAPGIVLQLRYRPGGSADEAVARAELAQRRARDAQRPSASFGPHRDDLELELDTHAARLVASQGQHRALTLALKLGETACIGELRGVEPLLLLDDVSSELDAERTAALLSFLGEREGQIFLTTTRRELLRLPGIERCELEVREGCVSAARD